MARKKNRSRRTGKDGAGGEDHEMREREEEPDRSNADGATPPRPESHSFDDSGDGGGEEQASNLESDAEGAEEHRAVEDDVEPKFGNGTGAEKEEPQYLGESGVPASPSPSGWETPSGERLEGSTPPGGENAAAAAVDSETEGVEGGPSQESQGSADGSTSRARSPRIDHASKEEVAGQEEQRGEFTQVGKRAESPPAEEPNVPSHLASPESPPRTPTLEEKQEGSETPQQEVKVEPELRESRPAHSRSPSSTLGTPRQRRDRRQAQQDQRKLQQEKDERARQQQWRQNQPPPRQLQPTGPQGGPPPQFMAPYPQRQQPQPQPPPRGYGQQPQPLGNPLGQAGAMLGNTLGQVMGGGGGGGGKETALQLRLDLNLDVDVQIKATVHGDVTLSLFQ